MSVFERLRTQTGHLSNFSKIIKQNYGENCRIMEIPGVEDIYSTKLMILAENRLEVASIECLERNSEMNYPVNLNIKTLQIKDILTIEEIYNTPPIDKKYTYDLEGIYIKFKNQVDNIHIDLRNDTAFMQTFYYMGKDEILDNAEEFLKELKSKLK
ncbi:hypothetical protein WD019_18925 [Fictibacillus sp. Mic-4]|uniref:hypothetical protein n=1 Tax=Fictibacillus sp. Mic-4 TaxID=3132826 RepID=UPI003CEF2C40